MTTFRLEIECDNAAFDPDPTYELIRILKDVQSALEQGRMEGRVHDICGNPVGKFELQGDTP